MKTLGIGSSPTRHVAPLLSDGVVIGGPRLWLRLEGAALLVGSLIAYSATGQPWWLVPLAILIPDVSALGYLAGPMIGARLYNVAHVILFPAAIVGFGWWRGSSTLLIGLALIWLAHIGMDRLLGYGLKYNDFSQHTHLGRKGRSTRPSSVPNAVHPSTPS